MEENYEDGGSALKRIACLVGPRKKKRRKEAQKQQESAERRKGIEARKKRKLEREFALYGGAPPSTDSGAEEEGHDLDEDEGPVESIAGTTTYESGDLSVTVRTSEILDEEDDFNRVKKDTATAGPVGPDRKHKLHVNSSKSFKKVWRHKPKPKPQSKRDRKKGKKKHKKR